MSNKRGTADLLKSPYNLNTNTWYTLDCIAKSDAGAESSPSKLFLIPWDKMTMSNAEVTPDDNWAIDGSGFTLTDTNIIKIAGKNNYSYPLTGSLGGTGGLLVITGTNAQGQKVTITNFDYSSGTITLAPGTISGLRAVSITGNAKPNEYKYTRMPQSHGVLSEETVRDRVDMDLTIKDVGISGGGTYNVYQGERVTYKFTPGTGYHYNNSVGVYSGETSVSGKAPEIQLTADINTGIMTITGNDASKITVSGKTDTFNYANQSSTSETIQVIPNSGYLIDDSSGTIEKEFNVYHTASGANGQVLLSGAACTKKPHTVYKLTYHVRANKGELTVSGVTHSSTGASISTTYDETNVSGTVSVDSGYHFTDVTATTHPAFSRTLQAGQITISIDRSKLTGNGDQSETLVPTVSANIGKVDPSISGSTGSYTKAGDWQTDYAALGKATGTVTAKSGYHVSDFKLTAPQEAISVVSDTGQIGKVEITRNKLTGNHDQITGASITVVANKGTANVPKTVAHCTTVPAAGATEIQTSYPEAALVSYKIKANDGYHIPESLTGGNSWSGNTSAIKLDNVDREWLNVVITGSYLTGYEDQEATLKFSGADVNSGTLHLTATNCSPTAGNTGTTFTGSNKTIEATASTGYHIDSATLSKTDNAFSVSNNQLYVTGTIIADNLDGHGNRSNTLTVSAKINTGTITLQKGYHGSWKQTKDTGEITIISANYATSGTKTATYDVNDGYQISSLAMEDTTALTHSNNDTVTITQNKLTTTASTGNQTSTASITDRANKGIVDVSRITGEHCITSGTFSTEYDSSGKVVGTVKPNSGYQITDISVQSKDSYRIAGITASLVAGTTGTTATTGKVEINKSGLTAHNDQNALLSVTITPNKGTVTATGSTGSTTFSGTRTTTYATAGSVTYIAKPNTGYYFDTDSIVLSNSDHPNPQSESPASITKKEIAEINVQIDRNKLTGYWDQNQSLKVVTKPNQLQVTTEFGVEIKDNDNYIDYAPSGSKTLYGTLKTTGRVLTGATSADKNFTFALTGKTEFTATYPQNKVLITGVTTTGITVQHRASQVTINPKFVTGVTVYKDDVPITSTFTMDYDTTGEVRVKFVPKSGYSCVSGTISDTNIGRTTSVTSLWEVTLDKTEILANKDGDTVTLTPNVTNIMEVPTLSLAGSTLTATSTKSYTNTVEVTAKDVSGRVAGTGTINMS